MEFEGRLWCGERVGFGSRELDETVEGLVSKENETRWFFPDTAENTQYIIGMTLYCF